MSNRGFLFVISGPSGSGKTTLAERLVQTPPLKKKLFRSISLTTRPRRRGERNNRDYFFIEPQAFRGLLQRKKILEWTTYLGYHYATPREFVERQMRAGRHLLLCLDGKGALAIKKRYPKQTVTIFVLPPSLRELRGRILKRSCGTSLAEIESRLRVARRELLNARRYDYCIVNADLRKSVKQLEAIIGETINA